MENLLTFIEKQLAFNTNKNLFYKNKTENLNFISEIKSYLEKVKTLDSFQENTLLDYLVDKVLFKFCETNQYFTFNKKAISELKELYIRLFEALKKLEDKESETIKDIADNHYESLSIWLKDHNPFATKIYPKNLPIIENVCCAEYSAKLQIEILHLDINMLKEPILDIGCGKDAHLVHFLKNKGLEASGIDRFAPDTKFLKRADWFEFHFEKNTWGSLISNLGFSNHFKHHHMREDGDYLQYAQKYMEILHSLIPGGSFYYAPELPFIEKLLPTKLFSIKRYNTGIDDYKTCSVTKLS